MTTAERYEAMITSDLNIRGFGFKWKAAKEYVRPPEPWDVDWWVRVRKVFLALGGEYKNQIEVDRLKNKIAADYEKLNPNWEEE